MEKENLEIKKASEGLTAEDLENVNGGVSGQILCHSHFGDCPKECGCGCD